jgi:Raf kinase inhibitor-like YbhB/YbcL family protein
MCDDPDAPGGTWVHWVVYNLPPSVSQLGENANIKSLGGTLGKNSFDSPKDITYGGPYPPKGHGPHRYYFKVYALSRKLNLPAGATKQEVEQAMQESILGYGELMGTFERK